MLLHRPIRYASLRLRICWDFEYVWDEALPYYSHPPHPCNRHQGISVANPTVTQSHSNRSILVATQNIPYGVPLDQAGIIGGSFQVAYIQAVAGAIGMPSAAISSLTATKGRRLLSGVTMTYIVDTAYTTPVNIVNGNIFGAAAGTPAGSIPTSLQVIF